MNPDPARAEALFLAAADFAAPQERAAFLDRECGGDLALRARVEALLASHDDAGDFLQTAAPSPEMEAEFARLKPEESGERIGHYKLLQNIGEGGFGTVWMADQIEPVRRRVALKIIKLGMDTKEVIARFEQERQALAMMDHPNIAKVLDAGATPTGRPFFVMELVRGIKITDYCDQHHLPTADRLQLFIAVCRAVQHAHQKGIIHRDLKPSNILVTLHDGVPVPKVIDFGVAKAMQQQRLTDLTLFTQFEQMIGTPLYMSPEQAELSGLDIDTRSDIYSLGVLLYELLVGRTPFDPAELMKKGVDEIRRTIREEEPQTPSMFVRTMAADLRTSVAQHRQSDGAKLIGQIRGDLDWIVMKALEKDRTRRYETPSGFATDIQRHLHSEPVLARPPSFGYRAGKFVRKHKGPVAAAAAVLLALLAGLAASTALYLGEKAAWASESAQRKVADEQRKLAEERLAEVGNVQVLLGKNLKENNPPEAYRWFSTAAETGNPLALAEQALMLLKGIGVLPDMNKAVELLQTAADRGSARAVATLGECYLWGNGVAKDSVRGIDLIRQASELGDLQAIDLLGTCYHHGDGVPPDFAEALRLFTKASDLGYLHSLGNLAVLHFNGEGTERNVLKAVRLILKGANGGDVFCMDLCARCFESGTGVKQDLLLAKKWYQKAAAAGSESARDWLAQHGIP